MDTPNADLFFTAGCHLCDLAEEVVEHYNQANSNQALRLKKIDIAEDDALLAAYGERIPVLYIRRIDITLSWPFNTDNIRAALINRPAVLKAGLPPIQQ